MICIVVSSFPHYDFRAPHPDKSYYFIYPEAAKEIQFFYISSFVGIRYPFTHTVFSLGNTLCKEKINPRNCVSQKATTSP